LEHPEIYWENLEAPDAKTAALLNFMKDNRHVVSGFDKNAVAKRYIESFDALQQPRLPAAFNLYHGYTPCNLEPNEYKVQPNTDLQNCMQFTRSHGYSSFLWSGRTKKCKALKGFYNVVDQLCDQFTPKQHFSLADGSPTEPVDVMGNSVHTKFCKEVLTTTPPAPITVATRANVGNEAAVYASVGDLCGTNEWRWIYPVYGINVDGSRIGFMLTTNVNDWGNVIYINPRAPPTCSDIAPADNLHLEMFGFELLSTAAPTTTTTTTTTQTFINKFTEEDTAVTIAVVASVAGIGVILILAQMLGI
jgi:hypothetical protein